MFQQVYCLLSLLAVYLIKAVVIPLRVFSTNYYKEYPKLSKMVQNVMKAAQNEGEPICGCSVRVSLRLFLVPPYFFKQSE